MSLPNMVTPRSKPVSLLFAGIVGVTLLVGLVATFRNDLHPQSDPLLVHCADSLRTVMTGIAASYERETSNRVELSFGGSQTLLANLAIRQRGDLFLAAEDRHIALAGEKNLIANTIALAEQTAVIAVPKGNPKGVHSLADLRNLTLTLSQTSPDAAAIGKLFRNATLTNGFWQSLSNQTKVFQPTATDAANDVKLGAVDAAIVWDSMQKQYPDLEFIRAPELESVKARVVIGILRCSAQPEAAERFARYVATPRQGQIFQSNGFRLLPASR